MKIQLIRATISDAERIWKAQIESFAELLARYQDMDTSPGNESLELIQARLEQPFTYFYIAEMDGKMVGAIRVVYDENYDKYKYISPLFVLPKYRGLGIAQQMILLAEEIHGKENWRLDTVLQEAGNCYLYEKMGYQRTGKTEVVNEKITLVFYQK